MSEQTAPTTATTEIVATKAMVTAYAKVTSLEGKLGEAIDNFRLLCKTEALKNGWTKKQLTLAIVSLGGVVADPARASEYATFVFPNNNDARPILDEIMAYNAGQDDHKKRIEKSAILKVSRAKGTSEDPIFTLEELIEQKRQKALGNNADGTPRSRPPGGSQDQTQKQADRPKSEEETDAELGNLIAASLNYAKANGYDINDYHAILEEWADKILPEEEEQDESEPASDEQVAEMTAE